MEETGDRPAGETEGRSRGVFRIFLVFAFLLVAYPLSVGPVVKLSEKGLISRKAVIILYAPLDMLRSRSPAIKRFLEWYVEDVWKIK